MKVALASEYGSPEGTGWHLQCYMTLSGRIWKKPRQEARSQLDRESQGPFTLAASHQRTPRRWEEGDNGASAPTEILAASWFANEGSRCRQCKGREGRGPVKKFWANPEIRA